MRPFHLSFALSSAGATLALLTALLLPASAASTGVKPVASKTDGNAPNQNLVQGSDSLFYGTAPSGGQYGYGSLFQFDPRGDGNPTILHSFTGLNGDGEMPSGPLVEDENGNFYGVTSNGGKAGNGTIYTLTTDGRYITLYDFGGDSSATSIKPSGALVEYAPGRFAGTATDGDPPQDIPQTSAVYTFTIGDTATPVPQITSGPAFSYFGTAVTDGVSPVSGLTIGPDGNLYGTTEYGGSDIDGTIFEFDPSSGTLHTVHVFPVSGVEGINPVAPLTSANGMLYGTCSGPGTINDGAIYSFDVASHALHVYYRFHDDGNEGFFPQSSVAFGPEGGLWVTTYSGGESYAGVILDFTGGNGAPNRTSSFHGFADHHDGAFPLAGLTLGNDNLFYGVTVAGGSFNHGTIFSIDPVTLQRTTLHSFGKDLRSVANRLDPYFGTPAAIPGTVAVENYDLGGEGVAYHSVYDNDPGNDYRPLEGVAVEAFGTGALDDIGYIVPGEWQNYTVNVAKAGRYKISFVVNGYGGAFHLEDQTGENLTGPVNPPDVGTYRGSYTTVDSYATLPAGVQTLKLYDDTNGYNYVSMTFTPS